MNKSDGDLRNLDPSSFRQKVRRKEWTGPTSGVCFGYAQANLAIVPKEFAFDFFLFCFRNWQACPIIEVTEPGDPHPRVVAPSADLRTDLPKYLVFKEGKLVDEPTDVKAYWRKDLVCFLLGCNESINWALQAAHVKHHYLGVFKSNIMCTASNSFKGSLAVVLRLFENTGDLLRALEISNRFPSAHGKPVHIGDPSKIGIQDIYRPYFGPNVDVTRQESYLAAFWGCGVTVQLAAPRAKLPLMITHKGGHMFVSDRSVVEFEVS